MTSLDTQLDINALMEMGFSRERVEQAIKATNSRGIPDALEWLFSHPVADPNSGQKLGSGSTDPVSDGAAGQSSNEGISTTENQEISPSVSDGADKVCEAMEESSTPAAAMSLKCEECGKLLKSEIDATMHASRTGHSQFAESTEEIKPLTEEEKLTQKKRLQEKLEERRTKRVDDEKEHEKLREKNRRKTGHEISKAKEDHAMNEMKKIAEERRKEKLEEKRIRQQLKEQIARDRANMKAKSQGHQQSATPPSASPQKPSQSQPVAKKDYDTCRVQFRLTDGSTQNSNFKADDTLFTLYEYISKHRTDGNLGAFTLSTTFPRKTFNDDEMLKTLKELRLVPSTVLVLGKL